jgi:hypothetical protein
MMPTEKLSNATVMMLRRASEVLVGVPIAEELATIKGLIMRASEVAAIEGIGRTSFRQIEYCLQRRGLRLRTV